MLFTQNQINELFDLIDTYHIVFIGSNIGSDILSSEDKSLLKKHGIDLSSLPKEEIINNAFKFGVLSEALGDKNTKDLSFVEFKDYIKKGKFIPLTNSEELAIEALKYQAYSDIKNLSAKVKRGLNQEIINRSQYEKIIETTAEKTIRERASINSMVLELGRQTQDWGRDLGRISDYILHNAFDQGKANFLKSEYGEEALVYKRVFPGACQHCIKAYLTNGIGSEPRIFKLSDLQKNGTNIGRPASNWLPVVGALHPHCRCTLESYDPNYIWNKKTQSFDIFKEKFERKVQRKSKIKISVGNKNFEI